MAETALLITAVIEAITKQWNSESLTLETVKDIDSFGWNSQGVTYLIDIQTIEKVKMKVKDIDDLTKNWNAKLYIFLHAHVQKIGGSRSGRLFLADFCDGCTLERSSIHTA